MSDRKARAQTLQQRFGFQDHDLTTPQHDEIVLWLDQHMPEILLRLRGGEWNPKYVLQKKAEADILKDKLVKEGEQKAESAIKQYKEAQGSAFLSENWMQHQLKQLRKEFDAAKDFLRLAQGWTGIGEPPPAPPPAILNKTWEYPVMSGNYIIGFVDMAVQFKYPVHLHMEGKDFHLPHWRIEHDTNTFYFEVKTSIPSLGELVRQVRMYQAYLGQDGFYVVSPDDRHADALKAQDIGFVKYVP